MGVHLRVNNIDNVRKTYTDQRRNHWLNVLGLRFIKYTGMLWNNKSTS